jgi:hypothetical protein
MRQCPVCASRVRGDNLSQLQSNCSCAGRRASAPAEARKGAAYARQKARQAEARKGAADARQKALIGYCTLLLSLHFFSGDTKDDPLFLFKMW